MNGLAVPAAVAALVLLFLVTELAAAVLPLLIVIVCVPPQHRDALARLVAAADSSRRLRLWSALRLAIKGRRLDRERARGFPMDPSQGLETPFRWVAAVGRPVNPPFVGARPTDRDRVPGVRQDGALP